MQQSLHLLLSLMRCVGEPDACGVGRAHRDNLKCIPSDACAAQTACAPATSREARCQIDAGGVRETRRQPRDCERCVLPRSSSDRAACASLWMH